jgi:uncharacterized protein (TIGR03790 family)
MRGAFQSWMVVVALIASATTSRAVDQNLPAATIVVYNKTVPDSVALARFYAQQRKIPPDHVIGLNCPLEEEISREEYDATIAEPLRAAFKEHHWWTFHETTEKKTVVENSTIRFVALIKGIPLKIKTITAPYEGDEWGPGPVAGHNEAAVDSELSTLAFYLRHISGALPNPYFQSYRGIFEFENATMLLVCRLDGPSTAVVRRMITDSIAGEKTGLWGRAYVDASRNQANGFEVGDQWFNAIVQQLHKVGVPVVFDDLPTMFPDGYPITDCSLYYGWYSGGVAGPFARQDFRFPPGAVAVHIHSFSAASIRDANANWVGPLLARGAAATFGNVYEPYLQLTPHLDVFNDRLIHGFTFAESCYMSQHAISWMTTFVGDPLYRPFPAWAQIIEGAKDTTALRSPNEWQSYHDFAVKNISKPTPQYRLLARQFAIKTRNASMLEDLGSIEARDANYAAATSCYQQARALYGKRDDILRVVLEESDAWIKAGKPKKAIDLVRTVMRIVSPDVPAMPLLRKVEQDILSPPPPPMPTPVPTPTACATP